MAYSHTVQSPREDPAGTTHFGQSLAHGLPFFGSQSLQVALPISHGVRCAMPVLIQKRSKVPNSLFLAGFTHHCIYMHTHTHTLKQIMLFANLGAMLSVPLISASQPPRIKLSVVRAPPQRHHGPDAFPILAFASNGTQEKVKKQQIPQETSQ